MNPIHLLAGLVAALILLIDIAVVAGFRSSYDTPLMLYTGLVFGQLALLAFWCGRRGGNPMMRIVITLGVACCLGQPLGSVTGTGWAAWSTLLGLFVAITGSASFLIRRLEFDLGGQQRVPPHLAPRPNRPRSQYTLGGILSLMTVVAVACGLWNRIEFPHGEARAVAGYGMSLTLTAMVAFWALISGHRILTRITVMTITCVAAGWLMAQTENYQDAWFFTNVAIIEAFVICAGFSVPQLGRIAPNSAR